jgi:phosphate ABC transporter phosphate-binding protein
LETEVWKMKTTYIIASAIVLIVIVIGSVFAYMYLTRATTSTPTGKLAPAALSGAGSTLVFPLMSVWTPVYSQVQPGITVDYDSVGSGTGISYLTQQLVDFGASDAPMTAAQYAAVPSTVLTIPESASAVVPAYNIPNISQHLNFTGTVLANIFLGKITNWNDSAIASLNPGVSLPNQAILTVHRSDGSGTMFAFTDYLSDASSQWATGPGKGTSIDWPVGKGAPKNAGVAAYIAETPYSIGPLEIAYEIQNPGQINYGAVQNAAGNYILANVTNIASALQAGASSGLPAGNASWTAVSIIDNIYNDTAATNAYPITTFTYLLVYQRQTNYDKGAALVNFLSWIVNSAQTYGEGLGYVPLPSNVVAIDNATIGMITYNGQPISAGT